MVTQEDVLTFLSRRVDDGRSASYEDLIREFWLSPEAACDHLKRLWRERLIETREARPPRFHFRLEPGESIRGLRFRLAARGRQRLQWYRRRREAGKGWLLFE